MKIIKNQNTLKASIRYKIIFIILLAVLAGCKPQNPLPALTIRDIQYGPDKENTMDISLPGGRTVTTPAIILIHGGAWTGGDKSDFSFLRGYFSDRGFAAFSVNYRLAKNEGTGIKDIIDDMDLVTVYIKEKSAYWTYSRDVIFLIGHSAGGHIALLYSFSRSTGGTVRGVVSYCGIADLTDPALEKYIRRMHLYENPISKKPFDRISFVAGRDRNARKAFSPQFITQDMPVLLICGKKDLIIPWRQSDNLHRKMKERGFDSTLYVYPDMGHDITPHYGEIIKNTEQWIRDRI